MAVWLFAPTIASAQDTTLARLIRQHQYPMAVAGQQFSGTGWERLTQAMQKTNFVLLGEAHGTTQIPLFATAVARVYAPKLYVGEIDRYVAQDLTRLTAQPGLPVAHMEKYPQSLSFSNWAEEYEFMRALRSQKVELIGVEQVNFAASGRLYALMAEKSKSKQTKVYLQKKSAAFVAQDRVCMQNGTYGYSIITQRQSAIDSLLSLTRPESKEVQQMAQAYATSYELFKASMAEKTARKAHETRISLMKRNLLQELRPYQQQPGQPLPKMLFKFGAAHMASSLGFSGLFDVGNLVLNLADAQDQKSLHVLVMGKQGRAAGGSNRENPSKNSNTYSPGDISYLKPFFAQSGSDWTMVDLLPARRALLRHKLLVADPEVEKVLLGYDYLVIIPETTAGNTF